jgi:hypothetical protein
MTELVTLQVFLQASDNSIYEEIGGAYWIKQNGQWLDTGIHTPSNSTKP